MSTEHSESMEVAPSARPASTVQVFVALQPLLVMVSLLPKVQSGVGSLGLLGKNLFIVVMFYVQYRLMYSPFPILRNQLHLI